jgi:hypothetical protein
MLSASCETLKPGTDVCGSRIRLEVSVAVPFAQRIRNAEAVIGLMVSTQASVPISTPDGVSLTVPLDAPLAGASLVDKQARMPARSHENINAFRRMK